METWSPLSELPSLESFKRLLDPCVVGSSEKLFSCLNLYSSVCKNPESNATFRTIPQPQKSQYLVHGSKDAQHF